VNSKNLVVIFPFVDIVWLMNEMLWDLTIAVTPRVKNEYTTKYINHRFLPPIKDISIHPVWLIDEYVRIFRNDV
jgi:hypothetical protein